jgi:hypothetical protein
MAAGSDPLDALLLLLLLLVGWLVLQALHDKVQQSSTYYELDHQSMPGLAEAKHKLCWASSQVLCRHAVKMWAVAMLGQ